MGKTRSPCYKSVLVPDIWSNRRLLLYLYVFNQITKSQWMRSCSCLVCGDESLTPARMLCTSDFIRRETTLFQVTYSALL